MYLRFLSYWGVTIFELVFGGPRFLDKWLNFMMLQKSPLLFIKDAYYFIY